MSTNSHITAVLNRLRASLGTGETPPGSNHNFITVWYNKTVDKIGDGPWCEMTATYAYWLGGAKKLKRGRAYTVYGAQDAVAGVNGSSWHWGTKGMRAGDQVYFNWQRSKSIQGIDHTGVVEKVMGDGTFYTLEGNTKYNKLLRMRRDSTYVVGYVRYDWALLNANDLLGQSKVKPPSQFKPKPDKELVQQFQTLLEVKANGFWDASVDLSARRMRHAALTYTSRSKPRPGFPFAVARVQDIIDTYIDNRWGPNSQAKLVVWVKAFQKMCGLTTDGIWGPKTDNKFLSVRKNNYRVY